MKYEVADYLDTLPLKVNHMNRLKNISYLFAALVIMASGCNRPGSTAEYKEQEGHPPSLNTPRDEPYPADVSSLPEFVEYAASSGRMEMQMSKLALENAESNEVKELAQMILNDHERADNKLQELGQQNNWHIPTGMFDEHKQMIAQLNSSDKSGFDKRYLQHMLKGHAQAIAIFEQVAEKQPDPDANSYTDETGDGWNPVLLEWVKNTLPVLKKHREKTQTLQQQIDNKPQS